MYDDWLTTMMGALVCIFFIATTISISIVVKLLTSIDRYKREIDKLRQANSELWHEFHLPYLKNVKPHIEDEM
jgi:transcriptional regulator of met regulon